MKLTARDILRLIAKHETATLECKEAKGGLPYPTRIRPESDQNPTRTRPEPDQNPTRIRPEVLKEMAASCRLVYEAISEDCHITYRAMESKLGLNKDTINSAVGALIARNLLRRVGPKKGGHWEVLV